MLEDWNDPIVSNLQKVVCDFQNSGCNPPKDPTLFDIAGFPSRENVFSNILKFYLNDNKHEFHGYGNSILQALLAGVNKTDEIDLSIVNISREVTTKQYKRIDLVIETKTHLIGIENKVYHVLNNDLADYSEFLNSLSFKPKIKIVLNLTIDKPESEETSGFQFVSYKTFLKHLASITSTQPSNKFQLFFKDFIDNLNKHYPAVMTQEQIDFYIKNESSINDINVLSNQIKNYLNHRGAEILNLVKTEFKEEPWEIYTEGAAHFELQHFTFPYFKLASYVAKDKITIEIDTEKKLKAQLLEILKKDYEESTVKDWIYVKEYRNISNVKDQDVADDINKMAAILKKFQETNSATNV